MLETKIPFSWWGKATTHLWQSCCINGASRGAGRQVLWCPEHPRPGGSTQPGAWWKEGACPQCGNRDRLQILRFAFALLISKPAFSSVSAKREIVKSKPSDPSFVLVPPFKPAPSYPPQWNVLLEKHTQPSDTQDPCPEVQPVGPPNGCFKVQFLCQNSHPLVRSPRETFC